MPIDPNKILLRDPQDAIPDVYRRPMARDEARRRVKIRAAVLAWRFDAAAVRLGFEVFARRAIGRLAEFMRLEPEGARSFAHLRASSTGVIS